MNIVDFYVEGSDVKNDVKLACAHVWIYHTILTPFSRHLWRLRPRTGYYFTVQCITQLLTLLSIDKGNIWYSDPVYLHSIMRTTINLVTLRFEMNFSSDISMLSLSFLLTILHFVNQFLIFIPIIADRSYHNGQTAKYWSVI